MEVGVGGRGGARRGGPTVEGGSGTTSGDMGREVARAGASTAAARCASTDSVDLRKRARVLQPSLAEVHQRQVLHAHLRQRLQTHPFRLPCEH